LESSTQEMYKSRPEEEVQEEEDTLDMHFSPLPLTPTSAVPYSPQEEIDENGTQNIDNGNVIILIYI